MWKNLTVKTISSTGVLIALVAILEAGRKWV